MNQEEFSGSCQFIYSWCPLLSNAGVTNNIHKGCIQFTVVVHAGSLPWLIGTPNWNRDIVMLLVTPLEVILMASSVFVITEVATLV